MTAERAQPRDWLSLHAVADATDDRETANREYRHAIIEARQAGYTLREIADAAGTSAPNILRIIRRATRGTDGP